MKQLKSADPWCEPDIWYPRRPLPGLLRCARNDSSNSCHCEERSDEAISRGAEGDHLFGSDHQAQRFLSTQGQIDNFFHLRRDHVTAVEHTARCNTGWQMVPAK